jgi:hypothetical protein
MDTAPKYGDVILWAAYAPERPCVRCIGKWFEAVDGGFWSSSALRVYPQFWQALPAPPVGIKLDLEENDMDLESRQIATAERKTTTLLASIRERIDRWRPYVNGELKQLFRDIDDALRVKCGQEMTLYQPSQEHPWPSLRRMYLEAYPNRDVDDRDVLRWADTFITARRSTSARREGHDDPTQA